MILNKYLGTHNLLYALWELVLIEQIQCPPAVICNSELILKKFKFRIYKI